MSQNSMGRVLCVSVCFHKKSEAALFSAQGSLTWELHLVGGVSVTSGIREIWV